MVPELKPPLISLAVFQRERELCRQLSRENNGKCNWGTCDKCGVIPLLYKLYEGKLLEDQDEIKRVKEEILRMP